MAYKNTPLTGLSVKQIQILIEARNRPGVHTYYPGGHNVMASSYRCRIQHEWKINMSVTLFVERADTTVPAIVDVSYLTEALRADGEKFGVAFSNVLRIYIYSTDFDAFWEDQVYQIKLSNSIIFELVATTKGIKFFFDGEELHHYDHSNVELYRYIQVESIARGLNPIIVHQYHFFQPPQRTIEGSAVLDQDEFFVAGCILSLDLRRKSGIAVMIDHKEYTPVLSRLEYRLMFLSTAFLMHSGKTRERTVVLKVPPISPGTLYMSDRFRVQDITATLVTL